MGRYKCGVCGFVYDEEKEGAPFESLKECPVCRQPASVFKKLEAEGAEKAPGHGGSYRCMEAIQEMAKGGKSIIEAMGTQLPMPGWDDIVILGAQLNPPPLEEHTEVSLRTVIGKNAKKPMILEGPMYVSHMSFGALSREAKTALAMGSASAGTAMCSGEGGILPEERAAAYKYIFEYVPNRYSVTPENLASSDAIKIKIGQGTKPGMGGHLPGDKVTPEIAAVREKPLGKDVISPSKFDDINTKEDLKELVYQLRESSGGRPIGIKIAAGKIEKDLEYCVFAEPDFITIDGRGGATGASPKIIRDATSVPTIFALYRARKFLDEAGADIDLIMTGGFRVSSDVAKAIAMGATAVAVASAAMVAAGCQQYRDCGSGRCPAGIATQNEELRKRFDMEAGAGRVANYFNVCFEELRTFARITGHKDIHNLSVEDIGALTEEISRNTNIPHV